ncbi:unnamed protein product [marine sediment metagenome]|uniref:Tripartite ATP-independent periplasmic transporters DctQ component domain-containing protein n=1 Tax=marine sediment metagenome TaxID=412755 RepID=X1UXU5_9ZZZZ
MKHINAFISVLSGGLVCFIGLGLLVDFITRIIKKPVPWVTEGVVFALVVIIFLGLSHCEEKHFHVKADVLIVRLPLELRHVANLFGYFVALFTLAMVSYAAGTEALISTRTHEVVGALVCIPVYPVKIVLFIGCVFYWIQLLLNSIQESRQMRVLQD